MSTYASRPTCPSSCAARAPTSRTTRASGTSTASPGCSSCRPATAATELAEAAAKQAKRARVLPAVVLRAPQGHRAGRAARAPRPRRPEPDLLHDRRRRGRRERVEGGQAVLQAHRQADEAQGDQPRRSPTTARRRARCRSPASRRAKAMFEPLVPGAHKVPNTNFYRAPEHGDDLEAFGLWAADRIEEAIEFEGPETVAAVFLEPVQNSGGCFPPPPGYFAAGPRDLRQARRAARLRRGDLRVRPARPLLRLRSASATSPTSSPAPRA